MINLYCVMYKGHAECLAPLVELTSVKTKWLWTDVHQKAFDRANKILIKEVLLTYPNFTNTFNIHTDASDMHLGAVIIQENMPITF